MKKEEKRKQLIVSLNEELFYDVKKRATQSKTSIKLWVIGAILDKIFKENKGQQE